jgi:hypothetical protein
LLRVLEQAERVSRQLQSEAVGPIRTKGGS